jgi:hypothetical protein
LEVRESKRLIISDSLALASASIFWAFSRALRVSSLTASSDGEGLAGATTGGATGLVTVFGVKTTLFLASSSTGGVATTVADFDGNLVDSLTVESAAPKYF